MTDVARWLARIGADELRGWLDLADADPWFGRENELHAWGYARVWAAVCNAFRGAGVPPARSADLVREFGYDVPEPRPRTAAERAAVLSGGATAAVPAWLAD